MSYAIEWHASARRAFSRLDLTVQEAVLDELELLAAGGGLLPNRPLPAAVEHDLIVEASGHLHYVFARVEYDGSRQTIVVTRLGHHARPAGA